MHPWLNTQTGTRNDCHVKRKQWTTRVSGHYWLMPCCECWCLIWEPRSGANRSTWKIAFIYWEYQLLYVLRVNTHSCMSDVCCVFSYPGNADVVRCSVEHCDFQAYSHRVVSISATLFFSMHISGLCHSFTRTHQDTLTQFHFRGTIVTKTVTSLTFLRAEQYLHVVLSRV